MLRAMLGECHTAVIFPRPISLVARARIERKKCDTKARNGAKYLRSQAQKVKPICFTPCCHGDYVGAEPLRF